MSTAKRSMLSSEAGVDSPQLDFAEVAFSPNGELLEQAAAFSGVELDFSFAGGVDSFTGDDGLDF